MFPFVDVCAWKNKLSSREMDDNLKITKISTAKMPNYKLPILLTNRYLLLVPIRSDKEAITKKNKLAHFIYRFNLKQKQKTYLILKSVLE